MAEARWHRRIATALRQRWTVASRDSSLPGPILEDTVAGTLPAWMVVLIERATIDALLDVGVLVVIVATAIELAAGTGSNGQPLSIAFQRSGAVLIVFAIAAAGMKAHSDEQLGANNTMVGVARISLLQIKDIWKMASQTAERQNPRNPELDAHSDFLTRRMVELTGADAPFERNAERYLARSASLAIVEFSLALLGTIVWGFGDLRW